MLDRRSFIKLGAASGAGLYLTTTFGGARYLYAQPLPAGILDPGSVWKFAQPLVIPPAMPKSPMWCGGPGGFGSIFDFLFPTVDYYEIAVRQFSQQILPAGMGIGPTTVWGYGSANHPATFNYPGFTIEARHGRPVRVKWINQLVDGRGNYLPHLLPVDQTLHWANPPGGVMGRDRRGSSAVPYTGPVPMITHVHGAHTTDDSDGYAEAWFLPKAKNIPHGYAREGTWYDFFEKKFAARHLAGGWERGSATFQYPNDQRATTLWYHDHAVGMTRLNVYAGPAGFYLIRGGLDDCLAGLPRPAPFAGAPAGTRFYEIPLAIQDRTFRNSGALFYPDSRAFFEGLSPSDLRIPFIPGTGCDDAPSDVSPIWNPEFFGNTMVVNGRTWPYLEVEQRRYRLRLLNGCNSRFLILKCSHDLPFWQIGAEGGFLPKPVMTTQLLMAPAERADVIIDFGRVPAGTRIQLLNLGPDEPFGGGVPGMDFAPADPNTTGQVMEFRVVPRIGRDHSLAPEYLGLPAAKKLGPASVTRKLSLNELSSRTVRVVTNAAGQVEIACAAPGAEPFGPTSALLGTLHTMAGMAMPMPMMWDEAVTENPKPGATEVWELYNFTMDAHPMHLHQVMFEVVNRQPFDMMTGALGTVRPPEPTESGPKDTVIAYPGEVTRVKATFDLAGQFVWHCHIVEHEDNEMMRPFRVGPVQMGQPSEKPMT